MFIDKGNLLFQLNQLYQKKGISTVSLYAHQGMGKTRLIQEFTKDKSAIYFKAANILYKENFQLFKDTCSRQLHTNLKSTKKFAELFRTLAKASVEQPLVLILDDVSHLVSQNKRFLNLFESLAKRTDKNAHLFIILCKPGHLYDKEYKKEENPLFIPSFSFFEMRKFYPDMNIEDQILVYSITGGNPSYMELFSDTSSVKDTICQLFFTEKGYGYRMVPQLIRSYYAGSSVIRSILASLGSTKKKLQEICDHTDLTPSAASNLLTSLSSHGLIERIIPVTGDQGSRRTLYEICDGVVQFWYTFVHPYISDIELQKGEEIFKNHILTALDARIKDTFQVICRDFLALEQKINLAPFDYQQIGMWWGQHPTKKRTEYVSIAAASKEKILLGSCFWTEQWLDIDVLYDLRKHESLFPKTEQWYYLFSKSDFVSGFEAISGSHVKAYSLEKMCQLADEYL